MGGLEKDAVITYETLFELLRLEKSREELQKLDYNFLEEVGKYVKEKKDLLRKQPSLDSFSMDERDKAQKQLQNINSLLKQLYDRREKKIVQMAINNARIGMSLADMSNILPPERKLFDELVTSLEFHRKAILASILNPKVELEESSGHEPMHASRPQIGPVPEVQQTKAEQELDKDTKMVRLTMAVPKFVGLDLEIYGPFEEDDVAGLPKEIADVLIEKGRAEELGNEASGSS